MKKSMTFEFSIITFFRIKLYENQRSAFPSTEIRERSCYRREIRHLESGRTTVGDILVQDGYGNRYREIYWAFRTRGKMEIAGI